MDFKMVLFLVLHMYLMCSISVQAQTGSSFFYYYSPNQPMLINSQTFGSNPQAHQHLNPNNNPFNLNPTTFQNNNNNNQQTQPPVNLNAFPTSSPFLPHRPQNHQQTYQPQQQSSILDKIAFANAPTTQQPSSPLLQYHQQNQYQQPQQQDPSLAAPTPTSTFPGQPQPSAKLFNFLNQPFQFFQNSFDRFNQPQNGQEQQVPQQQAQQPQEQYRQPYRRPTAAGPTLPTTTLPQRSIDEDGSYLNNNQQLFYNYYNRFTQLGNRQRQPPISVPTQAATPDYNQINGNTPVSYTSTSNQYFTRKTTRGPTSYSVTIDADPTVGPTARVHVSMGRPTNTQYHLPSLPTRFVPLSENIDNDNRPEVNDNLPEVQNVPEDIESQQIQNDENLDIIDPNLIYENETETLTTTPKPAEVVVIIMKSTTEDNRIISTTTTATTTTSTTSTTTTTEAEPEISTSTTPISTTTTVTTTTIKPSVAPKIDERKPKRKIIRKKIPRKRVRVNSNNDIATVDESKPTITTRTVEVPVAGTEAPVVTTTSRVPTTTQRLSITTPRRQRFRTRGPVTTLQPRTRITTTIQPVTLPPVTTTEAPVTLPPVTTTEAPVTFPPVTTTEAPVTLPPVTTTEAPVTLPPVTTTEVPVTLPPVTTTEEVVTLPPVTTTPTTTTTEAETLSPYTTASTAEAVTLPPVTTTFAPVTTASTTEIPLDYQYYDQYETESEEVSNQRNSQYATESSSTSRTSTSTESLSIPTTSESTTPYYDTPAATTETPQFNIETDEDDTIAPLTTSTTSMPESETEIPTTPASSTQQSYTESTTETSSAPPGSYSSDASYPDHPEYDNDYYEYYSDGDVPLKNQTSNLPETVQDRKFSEEEIPSSSTPAPAIISDQLDVTEPTSTTSLPFQGATESGSQSTETSSKKFASSTEKIQFTTEKVEELLNYNDDPVEPTSLPEEIIEPLSTTEASTSPPATTEDTIVIQTTEENASPLSQSPDEEISLTATERIEVSTESGVLTATTESTVTESTTAQNVPSDSTSIPASESTTEKVVAEEPLAKIKMDDDKTPSAIDYSDDHIISEAGAEYDDVPEVEKNQKESININSTSGNSGTSNTQPQESSEPGHENNPDFHDEYNNYEDEAYNNNEDPDAEEKILVAQRQALQNALKNIRIRQNATSTTAKPEEISSDQPKKFMRRVKVSRFLANSAPSSNTANTYEDEEIGDSRSQILQKIQSFRTKLRRVTSSRTSVSGGNSVKTTTKRPRRVTRPSDRSTSSTLHQNIDEDEEHHNSIPMHKNVEAPFQDQNEDTVNQPQVNNVSEEPQPPAVEDASKEPQLLSASDVPEEPQIPSDNQATLSQEGENKTPDNSVNEVASPKVEADEPKEDIAEPTKEETQKPETESPKNQTVLIGELIIHEILPTTSTTTTTTTTTTETIIQSTPEISQEESSESKGGQIDPIDFETGSLEDEEIPSTTETISTPSKNISDPEGPATAAPTVETLVSTPPSEELSPITATSVKVTTHVSKSESVAQRKVKVILKRRKGAPPGSGTIARQVVRTRTRSRPKVSES